MVFETILQSDLQKMVNVKQLTGNLFSADNGGNKITVEILDGGAPATVSGSVYGYAIREDEKTVVIEGTLSGNKASIVLPASAYAVIGKLNIVIKVGTATVGACSAYVYRTTTDAIVDPGSVVPDISELLAQIGACEEATTAANTAATAANTAAANVGGNLAANYSTSAAYAVGDYCIKDGTLYRCTTAITSGENWSSAHWTAAKIGPDVSALKSAVDQLIQKKIFTINAGGNALPFVAQSGQVLKISATGYGINLWARLNGTDVGEIFVGDGQTKTLTLTSNMDDFRYYALGYPVEVTVENISIGISKLQTELESVSVLTNGLNSACLYKQSNGRNYFDVASLTDGYVSALNGEVATGEGWKASDYIPVGNKTKIGLSRGLGQFAYYDAKKTFISGVAIASTSHDFQIESIPDNAYYVRLSIYDSAKAVAYFTLSSGEFPFADYVIVNDDVSTYPEFQKIRDAVSFGLQFKNAKVFIKRGAYNLLTEFATEISASPTSQIGVGLGNGIHIIGESGAIINCLYTGSDTNVFQYLSPFYALNIGGGFTLENLEIHSSNCRYTIHDEMGGLDKISIHKYLNCRMSHDNTGAGAYENWYPQCIGGGLALHGYIEIDGCYFDGKRAETVNMTPLVSYHNCNGAMAQSFINVKNCYFDHKGTFRATWYGTSTYKTYATLCGNSFGGYPWTQAEGAATVENVFIRKYLNEVRS